MEMCDACMQNKKNVFNFTSANSFKISVLWKNYSFFIDLNNKNNIKFEL